MYTIIKRAAQELAIAVARPYVLREMPGWGKVYAVVIGDYRRDWFWTGAPPKIIKERHTDRLMELDISRWADRTTYFLGRWYDLTTQLLVDDFVSAGDTVVDIGANRGMFSFYAAHRVGPTGKVVAFEPNPHCAKTIKNEITANNFHTIEINTFGLGRCDAQLPLFVPDINSGEATFGKTKYANSGAIVATIKTGDEALATYKPAFVKIDVEGYECNVISGLSKTIDRCQPIILTEMIPETLAACGASTDDLVALMEAHNYVGFAVELEKVKGRYTWSLSRVYGKPKEADVLWLSTAARQRHDGLLRRHVSQNKYSHSRHQDQRSNAETHSCLRR